MRTLVVNFKNYQEVFGEGSVRLARALEEAADESGISAIAAPPTPMLALVAARTKVRVYSQTVGAKVGDKTTGEVLPEAVRAAGASGTILNHSEAKKPISELRSVVPRLLGIGMEVCICAETTEEAVRLVSLRPQYLAIEPPELIGSGVAVSKARPELIERSVSALKKASYEGKLLCGAGIVTGQDVAKAVELGTEGVLVASSVVKAKDWGAKLRELAGSLK